MAADLKTVPSLAEFRRLARSRNIIPMYREILADLETPVSAFLKIAKEARSSFLLESVEHGEKIGRYSFMGWNPSLVVEGERGGPVLEDVERRMSEMKPFCPGNMPPLFGGFVGFVGYESVADFEKICLRSKIIAGVPGAVFFWADQMVIFDHMEHTLKMMALCDVRVGIERSYRRGAALIESMTRKLAKPLSKVKTIPLTLDGKAGRKPGLEMRRSDFETKVRRIKEFIRTGDCIQVVFSQRFDLGRVGDDFELYRALRTINPSPYMFYFKHKDLCLVGSSPELLVKKTGRRAEIRPIAGTRRRGVNEEEDSFFEKELKSSPKEQAEHLMLVDLGRNDLGRVSRYASVQVKDYARIERFSHVMHLVSDVVSELKPGEDGFSLLRAAFPAGTVTGAPKIRAMEIIDEQEHSARGPYAGCLGYFGLNGDMDMCIMIRTIVLKKGRASVQAGAGIVFDSNPGREYQETVNKAKALFHAVELARGAGR